MGEVRISGKVSARGRVKSGEGFTVEQLRDHPKGWRRYRIRLDGIEALSYVESVKSSSGRRRAAGAKTPAVPAKPVTTLEKVQPQQGAFVVVSGYTRRRPGKLGHHGFSFVAVGDAPG